jgi:small subunit ribosomal protein S5
VGLEKVSINTEAVRNPKLITQASQIFGSSTIMVSIDAKKNLFKIPLLKHTVPHEQLGKFSGGFVLIKPAAPGTGLIAGGAMRAVLESAGVHDVLAKSKGSSNPHNVVKATIDALVKMRAPHSVAFQRGISLAKVFNG